MITISDNSLRQTEVIKAFLAALPPNLRSIALNAIADYVIGDQSHGLKHEPYYKYVNRQAGFPSLSYTTSTGKVVPGYASARQHSYVMAAIASGAIRPGEENRTHDLQNAWHKLHEGGNYVSIKNDSPYARYVVGHQQTRMHGLIGWRHFAQTIADNMAGALRSAVQKIQTWIQAHQPR